MPPGRHRMNSHIPKRIIQTGKTSAQSLINRVSSTNLRLLHPDYEYLFLDDRAVDAFLDQIFPQYRKTFDAFRYPIQRFDFFRYLAIYHYGGFYFDQDVFLASSVTDLLTHGCVFPFEGLTLSDHLRKRHNMDWEIGNYAFGAAPGHPFLARVIDNCLRAQRDPSWVEPMLQGLPGLLRGEYFVLNSTGPGLVTRTLAESPDLADTVTVLFPEDVCDMTKWNQFGDYGIHLMQGSWRARRFFLYRRLANFLESRKLQHVLRASRKAGAQRNHIGNVEPKTTHSTTAPQTLL